MNHPSRITILGATGSIGKSTLDVIARHPSRFQVFAVTAHSRDVELFNICLATRPTYAVMSDPEAAQRLALKVRDAQLPTEVLSGESGLCAVAEHLDVDAVMAAIVGAAGLAPTLAAVNAGKRILLANKESLVMAGQFFMDAARRSGSELLPIDSEHNAIFQCLPAQSSSALGDLFQQGVRRILLTASGGPFREFSAADLVAVTPEQAVAHPNWSMGRKISVDSASLMNKGLELIEACWLFGVQPRDVHIVIHPESVIHSMVEYLDGSVLAQMGNPDMRTPIAFGLAWPERIEAGVPSLDFFALARLRFEAPDEQRFPCLRLAAEAFRSGGTMPTHLNAANEIAVDAFLQRRIGFTDIPRLIQSVCEALPAESATTLEAILAQDARARDLARRWVQSR